MTEIERYLPHRQPMLLIDTIEEITADSCTTTTLPQGTLAPFAEADGSVKITYALELLAQSVGIWAGHKREEEGKEAIPLGMLMGARALRFHQKWFQPEQEIRTTVHLLMTDGKVAAFEGSVWQNDQLMASGRLNTYAPSEEEIEQLL